MEDNYPKAYKEVIEILKYVPQESVNKIPNEMLETFKIKMDNNYNFSIDINKKLEEQNLLDETKAILANIFRDYWATNYQRERIKAKENYDRQKMDEEKRLKYNSDIFAKRRSENAGLKEKQSEVINTLPIKSKKERFYYKIINFFKKLFKRERNNDMEEKDDKKKYEILKKLNERLKKFGDNDKTKKEKENDDDEER